MRRKVMATGVAVLAAVGGGAAVAAAGGLGSPRDESKAIVDDAAEQLGVDSAELADALKQAYANRIDAAVAADASIARRTDTVCAILVADCVPVLLTDRAATCVAAAHAGWRGLASGILENTVARMAVAPRDVLAYLGPGIGPDAFEVGSDVRDAFVTRDAAAQDAFRPLREGKWLADLRRLAREGRVDLAREVACEEARRGLRAAAKGLIVDQQPCESARGVSYFAVLVRRGDVDAVRELAGRTLSASGTQMIVMGPFAPYSFAGNA